MGRTGLGSMLGQVNRLFASGTLTGMTDGELLRLFVRDRDEAAFGVLVERHGPMVLGVCRRALRDRHATEDAFQATFLVLARRAASVRVDDSLGRWLHGVSRRVARRARVRAKADNGRDVDWSGSYEETPDVEVERRDSIAAIQEEVGQLPEKYRIAVELCYFEGRSHDDVARLLRWPIGTVKGRLARARERLRHRLLRRGVTPSLGALGLAASADARSAASQTLVDATVRNAARFVAAKSLRGDAAAALLAHTVMKGMFMNKLTITAVVTLAALAGITGSLVLARTGAPADGNGATSRPGTVSPSGATSRGPQPARHGTDTDYFTVEGDVARPGRYPYPEWRYGKLVTEAIEQAGGLNPMALRTIVIVRAGPDNPGAEPRYLGIDLDKAEADRMQNVRLARADRIIVQSSEEPKLSAKADAKERYYDYKPYVVEPPDLIKIEVLGKLPATLGGERLVRPDGTVALGPYGQVYVAGLDLNEIKEKILIHLRSHFRDDELGMLKRDADGRLVRVEPRFSEAIVVDVSGYNSKVYYVQGEVAAPGRLPITGNETVLDAISLAGGLRSTGSPPIIRLVRPAPPGACCEQVLPVDYTSIVEKGQPATNYRLLPGDRLLIKRRQVRPPAEASQAAADTAQQPRAAVSGTPDAAPAARDGMGTDDSSRLRDLEKKLDEILKRLDGPKTTPTGKDAAGSSGPVPGPDEFDRFWSLDLPSRTSPFRTHGGIGP